MYIYPFQGHAPPSPPTAAAVALTMLASLPPGPADGPKTNGGGSGPHGVVSPPSGPADSPGSHRHILYQ